MLRALYLDVAYVMVTMLQVFDLHFASVVSGCCICYSDYVAYNRYTYITVLDR
jgi:ABC-type transport system involved in Fe-S cluster assembly fused permease/ATPase subunit